MKFTSIMRNILFLVSLFIGGVSFAQNVTNSPYSTFGLGETNGLDHAMFGGIGNSQITMCDSSTLNYFNPASYNTLGNGQPLFSLGVSSRLSTYTQGDDQEFSPETSLHHFAFGFSFAKHFGMAFGLQPFSRRSYNYISGTEVDGDSLHYRYQGSGSINEAFIGGSLDLLPFKMFDSTRLAVGFNAGWLFGNVSNIRKSYDPSNYDGGVGIKTLDVRSFHYTLGAYFKHDFNPNHSVGLYATMEPLQNIRGTYDYGIFYSTNVDNPKLYDTTYTLSLSDSTLTLAPRYSFGFSYTWTLTDTKEKRRDLHPSLSLHASYKIEDWSKYQNDYDQGPVTFSNTSGLSIGVQFIPEYDLSLKGTVSTNFFERMRYRAGYYRYTLPYSVGGEQVSDFGTTFGIGIPVSAQKSLSTINFGFSVGRRGVSDQQQLNENYYGINFGITIAPSEAEKWFRKPKLN